MMKCNHCGRLLPDDSAFCQYCGEKMKEDISAEEPEKGEEALAGILIQSLLEGKKAADANKEHQACLENDADFGLVPNKPIYTLARESVDGEIAYLDKLYTTGGAKIKWNRRGSMAVEGVNGIVDIYDTYLPSGQAYKTIYINMYGAKKSAKAPAGFVFKGRAERQSRQNPNARKTVEASLGAEGHIATVNYGSAANISKRKHDTVLGAVNIFALVITIASIIAIILAMNLQDVRRNVDEDINPTVFYFVLIAVYSLSAGIIKAPILGRVIVWPVPAILSIFALNEGSVFSSYKYGRGYLNAEIVEGLNYFWVALSVALLILWGITVARILFVKWRGSMYYKELCYRRVTRIHKYVESGIITEEEFEQNKKDILEKIKQ